MNYTQTDEYGNQLYRVPDLLNEADFVDYMADRYHVKVAFEQMTSEEIVDRQEVPYAPPNPEPVKETDQGGAEGFLSERTEDTKNPSPVEEDSDLAFLEGDTILK